MKDKKRAFAIANSDAKKVKARINEINEKREESGRPLLTKAQEKNVARKVVKREKRKRMLAAIGLTALVSGGTVALLNPGTKGVEQNKNEITVDAEKAGKNVNVKNLSDREVFIEGIKVSNEKLEEINDTTLEDTVVKEVESKKTPDEVLDYLKDIYIQEYNDEYKTDFDRSNVSEIYRTREDNGFFLVKDRDQNGNEIIRYKNEYDSKDDKVDISGGLIKVTVTDENSKIIQKVLNDGNNNYTGIANYDNKALEKVEKIMDTGITWKDSMDNQQTDSKIKRGYKRNFIKSIVEYKENQIEEIKTENLGEER
mgnify:FL=1